MSGPWVLPCDLQVPCSSGVILSSWVSPDVGMGPHPPAAVADRPSEGPSPMGLLTSPPMHHVPGIRAVHTRLGYPSGPVGALVPSLLCLAVWWVSFLLRPGLFCLVTMSILREKLGEIPPLWGPVAIDKPTQTWPKRDVGVTADKSG